MLNQNANARVDDVVEMTLYSTNNKTNSPHTPLFLLLLFNLGPEPVNVREFEAYAKATLPKCFRYMLAEPTT